jgi:hypothetical protein
MRTIAVFYAGADAAETLWYCELDDLGGKPVKGDTFVYAHRQYEVVKTVGSLGSRDLKGQLRSGADKLLELLNTLFGDQKAIGLYSRLSNIGSGDEPEVTAGGITLPGASFAGEFDNLVFCYVKGVGSVSERKERSFPALLQAVSKLHAVRAEGQPQLTDLPAAGLPRIRIAGAARGARGSEEPRRGARK